MSELILDAATKHLSDEVLLRTPEESYEMILWEEERQRERAVAVSIAGGGEFGDVVSGKGQSIVSEWQEARKESSAA